MCGTGSRENTAVSLLINMLHNFLVASFLTLFMTRSYFVLFTHCNRTISLLAYLRESRNVRGPHLIVVPKSVVGNWIREFKKWCPVIKAVKMLATKDERQHFIDTMLVPDPKSGKYKFDVLVTSYEGILKAKGQLAKV